VHILVVEDEQRLGRLLCHSLQANRHVVDVVTEKTDPSASPESATDQSARGRSLLS
jgi:DNA-binding response OmpR family regulator